MKLGKLVALIACILVLPIAQLPSIGGLGLSGFGPSNDVQELTINFPAGGGTNTTINLSLPAGATITNATMNIQALPLITDGLLDYSAPQKLKGVPVTVNVTAGPIGASLSGFNWSYVQSSDADFKTDESENVTIGDGAGFANNFTGGIAHDLLAVTDNFTMGRASLASLPNGYLVLSWSEYNTTSFNVDACFQIFDDSGNAHSPKVNRDAGHRPEWLSENNRVATTENGNVVMVWDSYGAFGFDDTEKWLEVFHLNGTPAYPIIGWGSGPIPRDSNVSVIVTASNGILVTFMVDSDQGPNAGRHVDGQRMELNGSMVGGEFVIHHEINTSDVQSGVVVVGPEKDIAFAGTENNGSNSRAYLTRLRQDGTLAHAKSYVGNNDSFTTPTAFVILEDGTTVVAFTANYGSGNVCIRASHVSRNGVDLGEYQLANGTDAYAYPSVCKLPDNKFACAWGRTTDGTTFDIQARVFRADGTPEGAVINIARAVGINASWELIFRNNDSLALVYRTDNPEPYGQVRYAIIDLERALTGHIESKVLSRPGTLIVDARLANGTGYYVDVIDAASKQVLQTGLHNGDPVRSWSPYFLRLHLERDVYNASVGEPIIRVFGVATWVEDLFTDFSMFDSWDNVLVQNGNLTMPSVSAVGWALSKPIEMPHRPVSLDNASYSYYKPSGTTVTVSLRSRSGVTWSSWETLSPSDSDITTPVGEAFQFRVDMTKGIGASPTVDHFRLGYSILYRNGFILSAPGNITDGCFTKYKVSWTAQGDTASASLTVDGGMNYFGVSNGVETVNTRAGRALQAMMVLEGDGDYSPVLEGFIVSYEARSLPSEIQMEIDGDYKWSPPAGADLEAGVPVRDFAKALNAITQRTQISGNITIPLNFTSATAGKLRVWNLRLSMNLPPKLERVRPFDDVIIEENATQVFEVTVSDPDGDKVNLTWELDGDIVGYGVSILYLAEVETAGNHTVRVFAKDSHFTVVKSWNVTVVWIDHNNAPRIISRFPETDMDIRETENASFRICATDPDGEPLRYSWYLGNEKVSVSDNYTFHSWYDSAGAYVIKAIVTEGIAQNFTSWNLSVRNLNRSPAIKSWLPEKLSVVQRNRQLNFSVNATDPDSEPLEYTWLLDGKAVDNNNFSTYNLTFIWADEKPHRVSVIVSDGNLSVSTQWDMRAGRSGTPTNVGDQECAALFATIAAIFGVALVLWYRKKKINPVPQEPPREELPTEKKKSAKGPKGNVSGGKTITEKEPTGKAPELKSDPEIGSKGDVADGKRELETEDIPPL